MGAARLVADYHRATRSELRLGQNLGREQRHRDPRCS
jgi:hypothetical protein